MTHTEKIIQLWNENPERSGASIAREVGCDPSVAQKVIKKCKLGRNESEKQTVGDNRHDEDDFVKVLKKNGSMSIIEMADELNVPPRRIVDLVDFHRSKGLEVAILDENRVHLALDVPLEQAGPESPLGDREIKLGIASDLHFGSKHCQITHLHNFAEQCRKEGVTEMICPGDALAGTNVYPGQLYDQYAFTADEQEQSAIANLPEGFRWWILGGNHDYTFISKASGHNPMRAIASAREDVNYIGYDLATLPILPGVDMVVWHPSGGVPYSISYRLQKGVEQVAYAELNKVVEEVKPKSTVRFLVAGHLHIHVQCFVGPIWCCQAGAFEGQTNYLKKKGLVPTLGGWILKVTLGSNGQIKRVEAPFIRYHQEIENDWKNYRHSPSSEYKVDKPIFSS